MQICNDRKRMKNLFRKEGNGMSLKTFLRMWAAKMTDIYGRPLQPDANDDSYAACAWRLLYAET